MNVLQGYLDMIEDVDNDVKEVEEQNYGLVPEDGKEEQSCDTSLWTIFVNNYYPPPPSTFPIKVANNIRV